VEGRRVKAPAAGVGRRPVARGGWCSRGLPCAAAVCGGGRARAPGPASPFESVRAGAGRGRQRRRGERRPAVRGAAGGGTCGLSVWGCLRPAARGGCPAQQLRGWRRPPPALRRWSKMEWTYEMRREMWVPPARCARLGRLWLVLLCARALLRAASRARAAACFAATTV